MAGLVLVIHADPQDKLGMTSKKNAAEA